MSAYSDIALIETVLGTWVERRRRRHSVPILLAHSRRTDAFCFAGARPVNPLRHLPACRPVNRITSIRHTQHIYIPVVVIRRESNPKQTRAMWVGGPVWSTHFVCVWILYTKRRPTIYHQLIKCSNCPFCAEQLLSIDVTLFCLRWAVTKLRMCDAVLHDSSKLFRCWCAEWGWGRKKWQCWPLNQYNGEHWTC